METSTLDTRDVDEARDRLARSYCPHVLRVQGVGAGFRARQVEALDGPIGVYRLGYGDEPVVVHPEPFRDFLLISRPIAGALAVRGGGQVARAGAGTAMALDPDRAHELRFGPGCRLLTIKLPMPLLDRSVPGASRIATGPATNPAAWDAVTRFLLAEAIPHGLLDAGSIMRNHTVQLVAAAALSGFGTTRPDREAGGEAGFRRALDFIESSAQDDIGVLDVAAAAGMSVRAVQYAFRRHLGTTPLAHLREVGLLGARRDLLQDAGGTVAAVAYAWGFGNLGRFAAEYRRRFGHLPSRDHRGTAGG